MSNINELERSPLRIFLCHASEDKSEVRKLRVRLLDAGFNPWLDETDILPGLKWKDEIPKAVGSAAVVIVLLSNRSQTKEGYLQRELRLVLDIADEKPAGTIFVIPTKLEPCEVQGRLSDYQSVELFAEDGYDRLLDALRLRLQGPEKIRQSTPSDEGGSSHETLSSLGVPTTVAAFRSAVRRGDVQVAQLLIGAGVPPDTPCPVPDNYLSPSREVTALLCATMRGWVPLALALTDADVNVNTCDEHLSTPLIIAAHRGYGDLAAALIHKGADVHRQNHKGVNALMGATGAGHPSIVEALLRAGAHVDALDSKGDTALMRAATNYREWRNEGIVASARLLLAAGANFDIKSAQGYTALQIVRHGPGPSPLAELLGRAGAESEPDDSRSTRARPKYFDIE